MPRGGHNRLPATIKQLRGTYERSKENQNAPQGTRGIPRPSRELCPAAKKEFSRLSELLDDMGVLTEADGGELENLAIVRVQIRLIQKKLFTTKDPKDFRKLQISLHDSIRLSAALSARFGMTPADRGRVSVLPGPAKPNRWEPKSEYEDL